MIARLLVLLAIFHAASGWASEADEDLTLPNLRSLRSMNGINPGAFDKFWEKWPLVTTRYRADNGELRYVYANDIAFNAMKEGKLEFPDGSVFGKVAFIAEEDPQFPNSFEATNFTRMQLMVKDSKRFTQMDGWSYWLHVDGSADISAEDSQNALACHACHTLVKDRDFVFAGPTFLGGRADLLGNIGKRFQDRFRQRTLKDLNNFEKEVLKLLPQMPKSVKSLRMRLFSGSLHESIGPLANFVEKGSPHLLVDPIAKRFLVALPLKPSAGCKHRAMVIMDRRKVKKQDGKNIPMRYVSRGIVCDGKNKWIKSFDMPPAML